MRELAKPASDRADSMASVSRNCVRTVSLAGRSSWAPKAWQQIRLFAPETADESCHESSRSRSPDSAALPKRRCVPPAGRRSAKAPQDLGSGGHTQVLKDPGTPCNTVRWPSVPRLDGVPRAGFTAGCLRDLPCANSQINGAIRQRHLARSGDTAVPQTQIRVRGRRRRHSTQAASRRCQAMRLGSPTTTSRTKIIALFGTLYAFCWPDAAGTIPSSRRGPRWCMERASRIQATASGVRLRPAHRRELRVQCACVIDRTRAVGRRRYNQVTTSTRVQLPGHDGRDAEQRHSVIDGVAGPACRAGSDLRAGRRRGAVLLQ